MSQSKLSQNQNQPTLRLEDIEKSSILILHQCPKCEEHTLLQKGKHYRCLLCDFSQNPLEARRKKTKPKYPDVNFVFLFMLTVILILVLFG